jgi:hypothetical protein
MNYAQINQRPLYNINYDCQTINQHKETFHELCTN